MSIDYFAPIYTLEEFAAVRDSIEGTLIVTSGGFDPVHPGHISCLIDSKNYGDTLAGVVNGDSFLKHKKGAAFQPLAMRCEIICALKGVDYVVSFEVEDDDTVCEALRVIRPEVFTEGGDRVDASTIPEWDVCVENNIEVVTGVGDSKIHSSSCILEDWYDKRIRIFADA